MGEMASLWGYEHDMDQLGQKLLCTTLELENLKAEAMEETRKNNDYVKKLIHLLNYAIQERDEARNQLLKLKNNTVSLSTPTEKLSSIPHFHQAGSPFQIPVKVNSSTTESNSLSETYDQRMTPVESLFDAVSSPDFSNLNMIVNQCSVQDSNVVQYADKGSIFIDNIAKGRTLPQKGKFLQAVLESGPLLKTLLLAGPLPRWRNPPKLQPFQIPPVSVKGGNVLTNKPASNLGQLASKSQHPQTYAQMACGTSQVFSSPMLNFINVPAVSCLANGSFTSYGMNTNSCVPLAKRQRFC